MRAKLRAIRCKISKIDDVISDIKDGRFVKAVLFIAAVFRAHLGKLTMQMENPCASRPLMQIIHILSDYSHIPLFLQLRNGIMSGIRLYCPQLQSSLVVEIKYKLRIPIPSLDRRNILNLMVIPQPVISAECGDSALSAHSSACQHYKFLLHKTLLLSEIVIFKPIFEKRI